MSSKESKTPETTSKEEENKKSFVEEDFPKAPVKIPIGFYYFKNEGTHFKKPNGMVQVHSYNGIFQATVTSHKGIDWCFNEFNPGKNDIFVQSYPKCGTTLTIQMVYQILTKSGLKVLGSRPDKFPSPVFSVPWLEFQSSQDLQSKGNNDYMKSLVNTKEENSVTLWKTHFNLRRFSCIGGYNGQSKVIHVTRNPKDVICSGYKFFTSVQEYHGDFNTYFDLFINGLLMSNNFFDFEIDTINAMKKYGKDKILFLYFSDLIENPIQNIKKIIEFLNIKNLNEKEIKEISNFVSFKNQKEINEKNNQKLNILNKGIVGNWKNKLSKEQSQIIDKIVKNRIETFNQNLENEMKIKWKFE